MHKNNTFSFLLFLLMGIAFLPSCKKTTEELQIPVINDYQPLEAGKYVTYQLDSLVYLSFGSRDTIITYEVKYYTDAAITDNLGRPAFRIIRYIRKSAAFPWTPDATFMSVNTGNSFEFIDNNLRYVNLKMPIKDAFTWKGNAFIDSYSADSPVKYLNDWNFTYDSVGKAAVVGNFSLPNTVTVNQRDEIIGIPEDPYSYSEVNYCQEKYALGIGMVYRKFFHSEYQPGAGGNGYFADGSYGVTYTMIDHN